MHNMKQLHNVYKMVREKLFYYRNLEDHCLWGIKVRTVGS